MKKLLKAVEGEEILGDGNTKKKILEKRRKNFMEKPLHLQFMKKTDELMTQETQNWLKTGLLKKETEGMLMAALDQALTTNSIKGKADSMPHLYVDCAEKERKHYNHSCGCRI